MPEKEITEILKNAAPIPAEAIPQFFEMLTEFKKLESMKETMIQEITGKYNFYEFFFSKVFAERQDIIKKDFQIIDEGMKRNDRELITAGVSGLSKIVASSPFTDMEKLRRMLES